MGLSLASDAPEACYHLVHPRPVPWRALVAFLQQAGYPLRSLPFEAWKAELVRRGETAPDGPLGPLVPFFGGSSDDEPSNLWERFFLAKMPIYDCRRTWEALAPLDLSIPALDAQLFSTYLDYLMGSGFLPPPPVAVGDLTGAREAPREAAPR